MKVMLFFFFLPVLAAAANAAGIGVAPAELNFEVEEGKTQEKQLAIYNLEDREIEFEAKSSAKFLEFYHNGIIRPLGEEKIIVKATAENLKEGSYQESIYITSASSASGIRLNFGTAIKANVHVVKGTETSLLIGILTSLAVVISGLLAYLAAINSSKILAAARKA